MKMPDEVGNPSLHALEHGSREQQKRGLQLTESIEQSAVQKPWTVFMEISRLSVCLLLQQIPPHADCCTYYRSRLLGWGSHGPT